MKGIYINKKDVSSETWETLCEEALGYSITDAYELLEVIHIEYKSIVPCELKSTIDENGHIGGHYIETTAKEFNENNKN